MNKKILAIPVLGALAAAAAKAMKRSAAPESTTAPVEAPTTVEGGPDAGTDGMSSIR